ncbi:MAG: 16S rRNA (cytosine(1402)-N(4))-methyltransferase RsmH [Minisyncoccia bacterium]
MSHVPVLLQEAIDGLEIKEGDVFVDGTLGSGGHSEEVAKRFSKGKGSSVVMIAIDLDADAISRASVRLKDYKLRIQYVNDSFRNIKSILQSQKITKADKILLDIGLSSNQFEESGRGFSFQKDEPLLMTFKKELGKDDLSAREIVNTWDAENIAMILRNYGEEKFAWKIAKAIVARRVESPIETTLELAKIVEVATPKWYHHRKIHPATKTFQALRITVNDEIHSLRQGLRDGFESLKDGGRMAIISFHSLEDREVKHFFKELEKKGGGRLITKKPITPTKKEVVENPRSRSAKLRIIEKI